MRHLLCLCALAVAALLFFAAPQVRADGTTDIFTFSESVNSVDTISLTWQAPASPDPGPGNSVIGAGFLLVDVPTSVYLDGFLQTTTLDTFVFLNGDGFADLLGYSLSGVGQLYTGFENAPTFVPGTYSGLDLNNLGANGSPVSATLTIVSTPEPSSLLLLFTGLLAFAGALALKKLQA